MKSHLSASDIAGALRHAGLKSGDSILLHSSLRSMGVAEGGAEAVIGAFLELTALLRLIDESGTDKVPKPINFAIDYLRSAGPNTTRARADIFKLGRRVAVVHVVAWQDDPSRPVASGNGKFLLE